MPKDSLVSVITVNFRQAQLTCDLLDSLQQSTYPNLEVFVVDNGSLEDVSDLFRAHYPGVEVIVSETNLGFAGGNNLALARAKGDYLFLINNDAELAPETISVLVDGLKADAKLGVLAPKIRYFEQPDLIQYAGFTPVHPLTARNRTIGQGITDEGQFDQQRPTPYAHGAAMMLTREALERAGLMPEVYFLYYEELDWCEQIRRAGLEIHFEPHALVWHKESVSVGAESPMQTYYLHRNRLLFMRRNAPWWSLLSFSLFYGLITFPRWLLQYRVQGRQSHYRALLAALKWHLSKSDRPADPARF
ncbi:glycosyltransferase family 2 protein [Flavilitoribacter nigricans]|uniref:dTDP-Rha--alpha-D-GlcNAc-pyrophosphate polyprenol alpha-3-L-rhamnosyltransferase n=1 Tax=Flavilitoribacter nigricans (strain ATCC 23147 / DSM 23189 / NBRC 102662 / NCIMB 1420 / SS-2) TaxID=1122177 RepID=A0A2D0N3B1_FLAN2|nr:glycosyltransferase family 2 protein [Flavilitoribacter nigricans]PHN03011.1 dTDP-Rha--alpha-D-GlcNAc-pyrophosphate polyprenol alpha-3-L-rhamnosyltransferase [Flavilitoribacter nigricans DSM 23189 = NBRC 102662]